MLGINDLKTGTTINYEGDPCVVLKYEHSKMGRGGAVLRTKLKNLKTKSVFDITFKGSDKFEEAVLDKRACTFLYTENDIYTFMDSQSFDQFEIKGENLDDKKQFLKDGTEVQILFYEEEAVSLELPIKMDFRVTHTEPGVRGDTAQGGTKPAIIETGAKIIVPLFVKIDDIIRINTVEGTYVERVKQV